MKRRNSKSLQTTSFCYSNTKSTLKVPLTFNKVETTKLENFDFVYLLSSSSSSSAFFLARHNSISIRSLWILNISNDCLANLLHSYLFWASCELQELSYGLKTVPKSLRVLMRTLLSFSHNNCVSMAHKVRPHLDYWARAVQVLRSVRRSFVDRFLYQLSQPEGHLVQQRTLLCI